jgi:hypothetical protein
MGYDDFNDDLPFPVVTSYISKAHYGMAFKEPYDSSKHTDQDRKEYDEVADMDLVWDQMSWYVKKVSFGVRREGIIHLTMNRETMCQKATQSS